MKDSQILSTLTESGPAQPLPVARAGLVFDACQVGVVLRAIAMVQLVLAVGSLYWQQPFDEWLLRYSLMTGASLPATLAWLIAVCSTKRVLARLAPAWQYAAGVLLGAVAGLYACAMVYLAGLLPAAPWLACALTGALLAALLVATLVLRARGQAPATTTARLSELQARIRPHFLFNTLNSAIALVRAEPARAEALLEDLSDLFRHALAEPGDSVSLAQEISLAQRYLAIEQERFGDRLRVYWDLDPDADDARLPPLLLQPLVENAVVHGVEPSAKGARVNISTERRGNRVVIKVINTTDGTDTRASPGKGHGMALANVRDRLSLLHDVQGMFKILHKDGVFQVRIEVPA